MVQIEIEHGVLGDATPRLHQALFEALLELNAVQETGEGIAPRQLLDLLLGAVAHGDVLMRRHPSAVGELLLPLSDNASVQ
jgi:hypothetical protein